MPAVIELTIERPAAGGRMIARHEGRIVFVAGAIPGERVRALVERTARQVLWARTVEVLEPSEARRPVLADPACGGLDYLHITCEQQRELKRDIIADAFRRIGKIAIERPVVEPSPEHGYRLRARLHVKGRGAGFFLEGTHTLCEARSTHQLRDDAWPAVDATLEAIGPRLSVCAELLVAENIAATERVIHLVPQPGARIQATRIGLPAGISGITAGDSAGIVTLAGAMRVTDTARDLFGGSAALPVPETVVWVRSAASFFQGNRYVTGTLVRHVLDNAQGERALDLYAGVGLFAVALAARGAAVTAVEADPVGAIDLELNAASWPTLVALARPVEEVFPDVVTGSVDVIVVDPPRTGLSPVARQGLIAAAARRVVYVSCDPATLARDAAGLVSAGYAIETIRAFDLFPNTAHVETVVTFARTEV